MKLHANAALSLKQRERMVCRVVELGWSVTSAAAAAEVSDRTCSKWVARYRAEGPAGLLDRSSAPAVVANRTDEQTVQLLAALRRLRFTAPELADLLDLPVSTISGILKRIGMGKLGRLGLEPAQRYERARPGELVHIDVKKLGRIPEGGGWRSEGLRVINHRWDKRTQVGYDYVHSAVDDHSRLAYCEALPDEKATTCATFLRRAAGYFASHGITRIETVMTDNALVYRTSSAFRQAVADLGASQLFTRPHCPWQNGKVERFNRTIQIEWAYRHIYTNNNDRTQALAPWLEHYNTQRRHSALGGHPPTSRLS
jgi:transposase InsO family protein